MKKHLIALAVAGAVAVPAMAQNVTVFGTLDNAIVNNSTSTYMGSGSWSTSVIGVKGTEDLGGGLKAGFQLRANLSANSGVAGTPEESNVSLEGAFGKVTIGTTDVGSTQAIDSLSSALGNRGLSKVGQLGKDQANVVQYDTPVINGLKAQLAYKLSGSSSAQGTADQTGVYVEYSTGALTVAAGRITLDQAGAAATDTEVGAKFTAGGATVGLSYASFENNGDDTANETRLSVAYPIGGGVTLGAGLNSVNYAASSANSDLTRTQIGLNKALSKRTSAYIVGQKESTAGAATSTYIGVVHTF